MSLSCFDALPIEIIYRILDNLDVQTILFSFRYVCRQFYSSVHSYPSYHFNFESISRPNFRLICRLVPFEHVVSLTLSDQNQTHGQIQLFLSLYNLNQFVRLRSLTLIQIEDAHLNVFLNSVSCSFLTSLSIDTKTLSIRESTSLNLLSSIIEYHPLRKLDLNMWGKDVNALQWPMKCALTYLRIRTSITLNQFYLILQSAPYLKTIVLKDFNIDESLLYDERFTQLTSLTCEGGRIQMDKLERCLALTPALMYLKLVGNGNLFNSPFDGYRWEKLIQTNLPLLEKFEFFMSVITHVNFDTDNVEQMISFFRTPFWMDEKQCSVRCDYILYLHQLILYTIPVCKHQLEYYAEGNQVSASNFTSEHEDSTMMESVHQLDLDLTKILHSDDDEDDDDKGANTNHLLFRNVTELRLGINGQWPQSSLEFLSTTIDLLHITKLSLSVNFFHEYMPSVVHGINQVLNRAWNIHTLSLFDYWAPDNCTTTMETVCAMITSNIKHLRIRVRNRDDMKFIMESLKHLISVTFEYAQSLLVSHGKLTDCLSDVKRQSSRWECQYALHVWLDHH